VNEALAMEVYKAICDLMSDMGHLPVRSLRMRDFEI
jgi:hypothetical protein